MSKGCVRKGSDNACDKRKNCRLSHARVNIWGVHTGSVRATNRYGIIFIGIWHHIYKNVASYLWECGIIFMGIWHHIYCNMTSYLLGYGIIFIGI